MTGLLEGLAIATLAVTLTGYIIKGYSDKASVETKLENLEKWKTKMEAVDLFTSPRCLQERSSCRAEIYKDMNRVEKRFDDFLRVVEAQNTKIGDVREHVVKILTLLEEKEKNSNHQQHKTNLL
jgi:hypothetical protein